MSTMTTLPEGAAETKDVRSAAQQLPDEFISCRDVGHTWRQYKVTKVRGGYERDLFCPTCKTARHQFLSRRGEVLSTNYSYPDGYAIKGIGRILSNGRSALRLENVIRAMDKAVETGGESAIELPYDEVTGDPKVPAVPQPQLQVITESA